MKIQMQDLKIKLENHAQFKKARDAFIKLGYYWGGCGIEPYTAPYLYSHSDGHMLADYFDADGDELSNPNSAIRYFKNSKHKEITLDELLGFLK